MLFRERTGLEGRESLEGLEGRESLEGQEGLALPGAGWAGRAGWAGGAGRARSGGAGGPGWSVTAEAGKCPEGSGRVTVRQRFGAAHRPANLAIRFESRERIQTFERFRPACPLPLLREFLLVKGRPFRHETHRARRQPSRDNCKAVYRDPCLEFCVLGMEVRRRVIGEIHLDRDAVETADLRHPRESLGAPGTTPQATCRSDAGTWHPGRCRCGVPRRSLHADQCEPS